jgi:hypothetical protein
MLPEAVLMACDIDCTAAAYDLPWRSGTVSVARLLDRSIGTRL